VRLGLGGEGTNGSMTSLLPFHGLSPVIKSLRMNFSSLPSSLIFDLILSFPLLEDLNVLTRDESIDDYNGSRPPSTVIQPLDQPMTGSLELSQWGGVRFIASRLLSLPGGIHFQKLVLKWSRGEDISSTMSLVEGYSHSVEYLEIACGPLGTSIWYPLPHQQLISDFSWVEARFDRPLEVKDLVFWVEWWRADWITMALRTIVPEHRDFQQIAIYLPYDSGLTGSGANVRRIAGELVFGQWLELDRLLAQLWESRSIRPKIIYFAPRGTEKYVTDCVRCLLPEMTGQGIIELSEWIYEERQ